MPTFSYGITKATRYNCTLTHDEIGNFGAALPVANSTDFRCLILGQWLVIEYTQLFPALWRVYYLLEMLRTLMYLLLYFTYCKLQPFQFSFRSNFIDAQQPSSPDIPHLNAEEQPLKTQDEEVVDVDLTLLKKPSLDALKFSKSTDGVTPVMCDCQLKKTAPTTETPVHLTFSHYYCLWRLRLMGVELE